MVTYSDVRGAVSHLLNIAAREWELEQILGNVPPKPFGDDRAYGLLAYSLATVCFRSPEARAILESMIANKAREIALMEERTKKHGRSRAV
jgi:hypothetical protein